MLSSLVLRGSFGDWANAVTVPRMPIEANRHRRQRGRGEFHGLDDAASAAGAATVRCAARAQSPRIRLFRSPCQTNAPRLRVGQPITPEQFDELSDAQLERLVPRAYREVHSGQGQLRGRPLLSRRWHRLVLLSRRFSGPVSNSDAWSLPCARRAWRPGDSLVGKCPVRSIADDILIFSNDRFRSLHPWRTR